MALIGFFPAGGLRSDGAGRDGVSRGGEGVRHRRTPAPALTTLTAHAVAAHWPRPVELVRASTTVGTVEFWLPSRWGDVPVPGSAGATREIRGLAVYPGRDVLLDLGGMALATATVDLLSQCDLAVGVVPRDRAAVTRARGQLRELVDGLGPLGPVAPLLGLVCAGGAGFGDSRAGILAAIRQEVPGLMHIGRLWLPAAGGRGRAGSWIGRRSATVLAGQLAAVAQTVQRPTPPSAAVLRTRTAQHRRHRLGPPARAGEQRGTAGRGWLREWSRRWRRVLRARFGADPAAALAIDLTPRGDGGQEPAGSVAASARPGLVNLAVSGDTDLSLCLDRAPGLIAFAGDIAVARGLARSIIADLGEQPWSDQVTLSALGFGTDLVAISPTRFSAPERWEDLERELAAAPSQSRPAPDDPDQHPAHPARADLADALRLGGVLTGRHPSGTEPRRLHVVVLADPPTPERSDRLHVLLERRDGLVAICAGSNAAARWTFTCTARGSLDLGPLDAVGMARQLSATDLSEHADLARRAREIAAGCHPRRPPAPEAGRTESWLPSDRYP